MDLNVLNPLQDGTMSVWDLRESARDHHKPESSEESTINYRVPSYITGEDQPNLEKLSRFICSVILLQIGTILL